MERSPSKYTQLRWKSLETFLLTMCLFFFSVEASVWEDMKKIRDDPYLPKELGIIGYVWDSTKNTMKELGTL